MAEQSIRVGVQKGHATTRTLKSGEVKKGTTLDRAFFVDEKGEKLSSRDCAQLTRQWNSVAEDAVKIYEDHGTAAVAAAYAEHSAGAVAKAAAAGHNVMRKTSERQPVRLTDTFDYVAAVRRSA